MGSPDTTWFCENGHVVLNVPRGYIKREPVVCPYCRSKNIKAMFEWEDSGYGHHRVSYTPIKMEPYTIHVPIYDVSKLFKEA